MFTKGTSIFGGIPDRAMGNLYWFHGSTTLDNEFSYATCTSMERHHFFIGDIPRHSNLRWHHPTKVIIVLRMRITMWWAQCFADSNGPKWLRRWRLLMGRPEYRACSVWKLRKSMDVEPTYWDWSRECTQTITCTIVPRPYIFQPLS